MKQIMSDENPIQRIIERAEHYSKLNPLILCPVCGEKIQDFARGKEHHFWNGDMFNSRLICPNNFKGVAHGKEYQQPEEYNQRDHEIKLKKLLDS